MTSNKTKILICDDDTDIHLAVKTVFDPVRYHFESAYTAEEALKKTEQSSYDLILLDIELERREAGLEAIPKLKEVDPELAIVMISGRSDYSSLREAMRQGATDYLRKPIESDDLLHTIERTLRQRHLTRRRNQQAYEVKTQHKKQNRMIGSSKALDAVRKKVENYRNFSLNVVIYGEPGTGKEIVARQLRQTLPDGTLEPFVPVDSSTIQETMAESILFGHQKGAFTGALQTTTGLLEQADGGVIYFDEVANMPLNIQNKLLRALEEKEIRRVGSTRPIPLTFRVICATNQNLEELARHGKFREDLYARLSGLPIELPPLRKRKEDIPELIDYFVRQFTEEHGKTVHFSKEAVKYLCQYDWPGNIRELQKVVQYISVEVEGVVVDVSDIPIEIRRKVTPGLAVVQPLPSESAGKEINFYDQRDVVEKAMLQDAYDAQKGNISAMARALGMNRRFLYTKLKQHGIYESRLSSSQTSRP